MQELSPDAESMRELSFSGWDEVSALTVEDGSARSLLAVAGPAPALLPGDASGLGRAPSP
ncbi:putative protein (Fragment) OS=Rhodanobacter lindaniclasticus OX=75310 GN=B1991_18120 PE=4 SV=1 [Rhodanobacter lindaniclasticus]